MGSAKSGCGPAALWCRTPPPLLTPRSLTMANDRDRHDPQPDHGRGPPDGKGRPDDYGRPVPPHKSGASIFERITKPK